MSHTPPGLPSASTGRVIQVGGFQPREHSVTYAPKHDERLAHERMADRTSTFFMKKLQRYVQKLNFKMPITHIKGIFS